MLLTLSLGAPTNPPRMPGSCLLRLCSHAFTSAQIFSILNASKSSCRHALCLASYLISYQYRVSAVTVCLLSTCHLDADSILLKKSPPLTCYQTQQLLRTAAPCPWTPSSPGKAPSPGASILQRGVARARFCILCLHLSLAKEESMSVSRVAFRAMVSCQHGQLPLRGPVSPHNTSKPGLRKLLPERAGDQIFKALWDTPGLCHIRFWFGFCERWQASSAHRLYTDRLPPPASPSWTWPRTSHCGTNPPAGVSPSSALKPSLVSQGLGGCCLQLTCRFRASAGVNNWRVTLASSYQGMLHQGTSNVHLRN